MTSLLENGGSRPATHSARAGRPLLNISDDPNLEYLSDGITESIINSLSKLPQLKVLARSTMFRFKRSDLDPLEVGRQLEADALLTGRILHINEELIIKLELIHIKDGSQIWGEQFRRKSTDIFEVQEEISQEGGSRMGDMVESTYGYPYFTMSTLPKHESGT